MSIGHGCVGNVGVQGRWEGSRKRDSALPSPTVFGRKRRSNQAKRGPSPDTDVIDDGNFPHNTGKVGSPKNKLPLPAPSEVSPSATARTYTDYGSPCADRASLGI